MPPRPNKKAGGKKPAATTTTIDEAPPRRAVVSRGVIRVSRTLPGDAALLQLHGAAKGLRVAVYADFYPVAYRAGGKYAGLDVDLVEGFSRAAGLRAPVYVRQRDLFDTWQEPGLWSSRVDLAIGGIGRGQWREAAGVEWTVPYFVVRRTVVSRRSDPIRRFPEDVTGVVAGTMGSTGMQDAAERMRRRFGDDKVWDHLDARWKTTDARDLLDLRKGRIQGLMRGSFVGRAIAALHPDELVVAEPWDADPKTLGPYSSEVFAFPCRRGSGLATQLSAYMVGLSHSGALSELVRRHGMD